MLTSSGKLYSASEAARIGVLDRIYPSHRDIKDCALEFAHSVTGKSLNGRIVSKKPVRDAGMVCTCSDPYHDISTA